MTHEKLEPHYEFAEPSDDHWCDRCEQTPPETSRRDLSLCFGCAEKYDAKLGMRCSGCREKHTDWSDDGQHTVNSGHNAGIVERFECGRCGEIEEVPRR